MAKRHKPTLPKILGITGCTTDGAQLAPCPVCGGQAYAKTLVINGAHYTTVVCQHCFAHTSASWDHAPTPEEESALIAQLGDQPCP